MYRDGVVLHHILLNENGKYVSECHCEASVLSRI